MKFVLSSFIMLALNSGCLAKDCYVQQFYTVFGTDNTVHMDVKSGKPCFVTLNARAQVQSGSILQGAAAGNAMMPTSHRWGYQSKPGYSGSDHFVVEMTGTSYVGRTNDIPVSGSTKLSVDVTVVP